MTSTVIFLVIIVLIALLGGAYALLGTRIIKVNSDNVMEFKSSFDLSGLPIITFHQGNKKYNFLIDSGSNVSFINSSTDFKTSSVEAHSEFMSASGHINTCDIVEIILSYKDKDYSAVVRSTDMSGSFQEIKNEYGVTVHGIIGTDFMSKYKYCIDFNEYVVYERK